MAPCIPSPLTPPFMCPLFSRLLAMGLLPLSSQSSGLLLRKSLHFLPHHQICIKANKRMPSVGEEGQGTPAEVDSQDWLSQPVFSFAFCGRDKHQARDELGEKRIYFILYFREQSITEGRQGWS